MPRLRHAALCAVAALGAGFAAMTAARPEGVAWRLLPIATDRDADGCSGDREADAVVRRDVAWDGGESAVIDIPAAAIGSGPAEAQQIADDQIDVSVSHPAYAKGTGPVVVIDAGHHNFHTADGRYAPFAALLRNDGFRVAGSSQPFTADALAHAQILVIANAQNAANVDHWALPTPSALTSDEIAAVETWVEGGGSLLLIADHMPFPGAVADLAERFGVTFFNGDALRVNDSGRDVFTRSEGTLGDHAITRGRDAGEAVMAVETFGGSALHPPPAARSLLTFSRNYIVLIPPIALTPNNARLIASVSRRLQGEGLSQGAVLKPGKGRLAVFGEAGMFTAQVLGPERKAFGFNVAPANKQFVLNVIRWLAGTLPD